MLKLNRKACALKILPSFAEIVDAELQKATANAENGYENGVIINFRDPEYSAETGGYHPVEISLDAEGVLQYATDFAYVGTPPFAELAKELDFSFELNLFGHMGTDYPLAEGSELFGIFQQNFVSYYQSGVFQVEVSE